MHAIVVNDLDLVRVVPVLDRRLIELAVLRKWQSMRQNCGLSKSIRKEIHFGSFGVGAHREVAHDDVILLIRNAE